MHRVIYMRGKDKYAVIFTNKSQKFILYLKDKKDEQIIFFDTVVQAELAIKNLGNQNVSPYYMGK